MWGHRAFQELKEGPIYTVVVYTYMYIYAVCIQYSFLGSLLLRTDSTPSVVIMPSQQTFFSRSPFLRSRCCNRHKQASLCPSPLSLVYLRLYSCFEAVWEHPQSVLHNHMQVNWKVCAHIRTPACQPCSITRHKELSIDWYWLKGWESLPSAYQDMEKLGNSAVQLSWQQQRETCRGSLSSWLAFCTAGGFQMTNSCARTVAQSCEAQFVLLHRSFLFIPSSFFHTLFYSFQIPPQCNAEETEFWIFTFTKTALISNFSWSISTANIPVECGNSIWKIIRYQIHEGVQHLTYLEEVKRGSIF